MRTHGMAISATIVAILLSIASGGSGWAQAPAKAVPGKHPGPAPSWHDCEKAPPEAKPAIDAARRLLEKSWLPTRDTFFAAYTMPGETRSPFDLSPPTPDSGASEGTVEARPPQCLHHAQGHASDATHRVRFVSPFYRFYEAGHGWSPPLRNGMMLDAVVTHAAGQWQVTVPPSEITILIPEQKPRLADATKLPSDAPWSEPIPGCAKRQKWNGTDCAPRRR